MGIINLLSNTKPIRRYTMSQLEVKTFRQSTPYTKWSEYNLFIFCPQFQNDHLNVILSIINNYSSYGVVFDSIT